MPRAPSDVDPRNLDAKPRKRTRKDRAKPEPLPIAKAQEAEAVARLKPRPANPGVLPEPLGERGWRVSSPHSDINLWEAQLAQAFGTNSQSVMTVFIGDLNSLCLRPS